MYDACVLYPAQLREFFQSCYRAMAARKEAEEIAVLMEAAESHGYRDTREDLMTWEQEVKIKGRQEGISLGQLRDKQDVLIRQLERKFGIGDTERELTARWKSIRPLRST